MAASLPHEVSGVVRPYAGNGRRLGYPTANIDTDTNLPDGVYFGFANMAAFTNSPALIFIGTPTTVGDTVRRLEVHVLDIPDVDYYDQKMVVTILKFYRPNKTFSNIDELVKVMHGDENAARQWLITGLSVA